MTDIEAQISYLERKLERDQSLLVEDMLEVAKRLKELARCICTNLGNEHYTLSEVIETANHDLVWLVPNLGLHNYLKQVYQLEVNKVELVRLKEQADRQERQIG